MKRNRLWAAAPLSLGLALCTPLFNPVLRAQSQTAPTGQEDQQKKQVFVGKVVKIQDGRYALVTDEQAGKGVYLDDQEKAKDLWMRLKRDQSVTVSYREMYRVVSEEGKETKTYLTGYDFLDAK